MAERCEVAGAAQGAELMDHRGDAGVQQCCVGEGSARTDPRHSLGHRGEAAHHHRPNDLIFDEWP